MMQLSLLSRTTSISYSFQPSSDSSISSSLVAPYLADMDEGVRFAAAESLLRLKNEEVARDALLQLFVSDTEESLRLRIRIAEGFAELGWLVHGYRGGVEKKLPDGFQLDREGHILARKSSP